MQQVNVSEKIIRDAIGRMKVDRVLPFRFIAAARYAPQMEDVLESAMMRGLAVSEKLTGRTSSHAFVLSAHFFEKFVFLL